MKRFLVYIFALLVPLFALAQTKHSIEIDASSFKPVNTDALTGVAIDKIEVDNSLRPCARIKLKVNRMTREDISNLQIVVRGGIHDVMKKIVAHEGNGLIIELTAKPQTRFYLHHDKYGDSNEVTLNLEGNKEYRLDAELCQMYSIVVSTNVIGADIYLDNELKGKSDDTYVLTVNNVMAGNHSLRIEHESMKHEQSIFVSDTNIHFKAELNMATSRPQYVVFQVEPKGAAIVIDDKSYAPDADGVAMAVLHNGSHTYTISAKDYHNESGTFVVSGAKVVKSVTLRPAHGWLNVSGSGALQGASVYVDGQLVGTAPLKSDRLASGTHTVRIVKSLYKAFEENVTITDGKTLDYAPSLVADFATVSLSVGGECEIYVNNEKKGSGSWRGDLATGAYIFEARKAGHTTTSITKTISAEPRQQSYTLPAPKPIVGTLNVMSSPAMADVYVDGKVVGQTPLMVDLIVGKHEVSLRKGELGIEKKSVNISEGQIETLELTLVNIKHRDHKSSQDNVITYTTKDNQKISPKEDAFDSKIVSNTYKVGVGTIVFEKTVTKIGNEAFDECSTLTSILIPETVTSIGESAFSFCKNLSRITIPSSVTSIGESAFSCCYNLTSITIPDSVTSIGEGAFWGCENLTTFHGRFASKDNCSLIVDGVLIAFAEACDLTRYIIPDYVASIGKFAFCYCENLSSITIPNSVTSIGRSAFRHCENLISITIPDSVTSIGEEAFSQCKKLEAFYGKYASTDNNSLIVGGVLVAFAPAHSSTRYTIPDSVTSIGDDAFAECENLTSITISDSVTHIGSDAFYRCHNLTNITIPDSVTSIESFAFSYSKNLGSVYCKATTPPKGGSYMFESNASGRKIYVPRNSVTAYKSANYWSKYADFIVGYDF